MKHLQFIGLIFSFSLIPFTGEAEEARSYNLVLSDGSSIPTTIVWKNIKGLDTISGDFHYRAGNLGFSGKNSSSGFIWMNDEHGSYYEFRKETVGQGFRWVGKADNGERMTLIPIGAKAPIPMPTSGATVRHYSFVGEGDVAPIPVTIVWDNIKGLGGISGTITYLNGQQVSFSGRNPESGYITFTASDGVIYNLWRRKQGDSFEWAGTGADRAATFNVTFVPHKNGAAPVPKPMPEAGNGETVRHYSMTGPYGQMYPATVIWANIKGLGPINGTLFSPGENLTINGQNSRSGFIYFNDQYGTYYELTKQAPIEGKVLWKGNATFNDNTSRPIQLKGK